MDENTLDHAMRICIKCPDKLSNDTLEAVVDNYKNVKQICCPYSIFLIENRFVSNYLIANDTITIEYLYCNKVIPKCIKSAKNILFKNPPEYLEGYTRYDLLDNTSYFVLAPRKKKPALRFL